MKSYFQVLLPALLLLAFALGSAPASSKNIGADPPQRCTGCGVCGNAAAGGPRGNCSSAEPCASGSCYSRTEGNAKENYPLVSVKSTNGPELSLSLTYDSYNADTSRARINTVLGLGWTHSYNAFLYSVRGIMFRLDGDGRVTKFALGAGGTYTAAVGYFETMIKNGDGSFSITEKDKTVYHYTQIASATFMPGFPVWRLISITDRDGNATTLSYSSGNLVTITDTYGRSISFTYDAAGLIVSITDPLGRVTTFTYDPSFTQLLSITDPAGRTVQYSYDNVGQIIGKTDKDGRQTSYTYSNGEPSGLSDGTGSAYFNMTNSSNWATDATQLALNFVRQYVPSTTSKTDGRGNVWQYSYDLRAYVTQMVAPDGATWRYTYDAATLMPASQTDPNGNTTNYRYDSRGNMIQQTDALGNVTSYTYEPLFNMVTSMTDAHGRVTSYQVDPANGNRLMQTDPLGQTLKWTYDSHGNVLTETDKRGNSTTYNYDAFGDRTQITDPLGNVTRMSYDAVGNLMSRTDPNNHTTTNTYDALDRIIRVTDALGHNTVTAYDGQGNRISVTDRDGNTTQYQYDTRSRVTKITDALGQPSSSTYDGNDNRVTSTDRDSHTTNFFYDVQNRLVQTVDALGDTSMRGYDGVGNRVQDTDADGHSTVYTYDALNRATSKTDAVGNHTVIAYDSTGPCAGCTGPTKGSELPSKRTDGDGKVIYYKYDGLDRMIHEVHKQGATTDIETASDAITVSSYDPNGNRVALTEPDGNTTNYTYDADNRIVQMVNATGDTTQTTYDAASNVATVTAPTTNVTSNTYDALNRLTLIQDGGGTVSSYTYDAEGNRLTETDGNGNTTGVTYDGLYRITQTTDPLGKISSMSYDPVGNLLTTTDRNGHVTTDVYDAINRRTSMTDALGNTTSTQYDTVGNVVKITDANAHATTYAYDGVNRRVSETYADSFTKNYSYDFVGNIVSRTDQNGQTTSYTYSDLYFLLSRSYPVSPPDSMSYDLSGRMLSATRGSWAVTFSYDGADRVIQSVQNGHTVNYSYNIPARVEGVSYPGGRTLTETMDLRSRLSRIDDPSSATPIVQYSYDAADRVVQRAYRNGTSSTYSYNNNDWMTGLQHSFGVTPIAGFNYAYDNEGNKAFEQKLQDTTHSEAYQYDSSNRLITYLVGTLSGSTVPVPSTQTQYTLDGVGNWPKKVTNALTENRTHNAVNEITGINATALSYDNNGNLTADPVYTYAYDEENRLTGVSRVADSAVVGQYQYDALSRRVQKIANPAGTPTTTRYFYDEARLVEEQDSGGATQATYVYGNYLDEELTMDRGGQTYYYHQNALWSVEAITDSAANVAERYSYDAYGTPSISNGVGAAVAPNAWGTPHSGVANPWMFTGRQLDEENGLYFYRARYYDDQKGRFLQRDPSGYVDGMNLYEYASSRPTFYTDPSGQVGYEFQDVKKIPWSDHPLPRHGIAAVAGLAMPTNLTVGCSCICCDRPKKLWNYACTVTLDIWIYLDSKTITTDREAIRTGHTMANTYGHEQLHAQNIQSTVRSALDEYVRTNNIEVCNRTEGQCKTKLGQVRAQMNAVAYQAIGRGSAHGGRGQPVVGRPNDPIAGTDFTANRGTDPPLKPTSDNLNSYWRGIIEGPTATLQPPRTP